MEDWGSIVEQEATQQGVRPGLARAVMRAESAGNPSALSPKGAIGLMQLMPDTAKMLQVDPNDPMQNIRGGVAYLKRLHTQFGGDENKVLAAYNAGPGRADTPPPETQEYIQRVKQAQVGTDASHLFMAPQPQKPGGVGDDASHLFMKPAEPGPNLPSLAEQGEWLARGGLKAVPNTLGRAFFSPSNIGSTAGGAAGRLIGGGLTAATGLEPLVPVGAWLGGMAGTGIGSYFGQKAEGQEPSPIQTGVDIATAGTAPLIEGGIARFAAKRTLPRALRVGEQSTLEKANKELSAAASARAEREALSNEMLSRKSGKLPTNTDIGARTQADILARNAAERDAAKAQFDPIIAAHGAEKVGPPPVGGAVDTRPTFQQLHTRQSKAGDDAAAAFKSGDYKTWRVMRDRKEKILNTMTQHLDDMGGDSAAFLGARKAWAELGEKERNSAVQKLMQKAHDEVTTALLTPSKLAGPKKMGGAFRGGTQGPNEIIDALKAVSDPAQFEEFKQGTTAMLVEKSVKDGSVDPAKLKANIKRMGGNFTALHTPAEQKTLNDAADGLQKLLEYEQTSTKSAENLKASIPAMKEGMPKEIPEMPPLAHKMLKYGIGAAATGGGIFSYVAAQPGMISASAKGTAILGATAALLSTPSVVSTLLKSPLGRQHLAKIAETPFKSGAWDEALNALIQLSGTTTNRYVQDVPTPPLPNPPISQR